MDRYIGDILDDCGRDTRNDNFTGISKEDALRFARYAQQRLQGVITKKYPSVFLYTYKQNLVAEQSLYSVADNVSLGTRIDRVRYNPTTDDVTWNTLRNAAVERRYPVASGVPRYWTRENGQVRLDPPPSASVGQIEIRYERTLDIPELRRGQVNGTPSGTDFDLTHPTSGAPTTADEALFIKNQYCSIVDAYGNVMMRNGIISSYNATTDVVTLAAAVSTYLVTGYTLANLADGYLVLNKYSTTHSALHNDCERYIVEYVNRRLYKRDSRNDTTLIEAELQPIEDEIVNSYKTADHAVKEIPLTDQDLLVFPIYRGL